MGPAAMHSDHGRVALRDCGRPVLSTAPTGFDRAARLFPSIEIEPYPSSAAPSVTTMSVSLDAWRDPTFDWWSFDRAIDRATATTKLAITIDGPVAQLPGAAIELLTRCQRVLDRRNHASATRQFDALLERHRALHDLSLPLVQADFDHARDVWQWVLRLEPQASLAVQIAALFHDIERLVSEPERRIEQHAVDYQAFKDHHGARGAELTAALLVELDLQSEIVCRAARLIATHERQPHEGEAALLNDADALSFFSLNSAGFADYYGVEHTKKKVAYSLDRLRRAARRQLDEVRLRPEIRAMIDAHERPRLRNKPALRLVIFGLTVSSSWGNGHATLWRGLCRALARAGHRVVFFERDVPYYAQRRDLSSSDEFDLVLYGTFGETAERARRELAEADAAFVTSYCPDARQATDLLASTNTLRVFYDLDTPVTLARLDRNETIEYVPEHGLGEFDLVLSYTGGRALDQLCERLGARTALPLYGSVDPEQHHPTASHDRYKCDFSYLGTWAEDRQAQLEKLFLAPARRALDRRFVIGGSLYPHDFPWSPNIWFCRHVPPPEHSAFYCSSRLTLSITRGAMAAMGYCPSGRLFEAAACGVPLVSDSWEGLDSFFEPDRELLVAHTTDEALAALQRSDADLRRIARAARARALAEHSADARAAQLVDYLRDSGAP